MIEKLPTAETDVAVVGGGPAGLTAALALARAGVSTTLVGKTANAGKSDNRTTALLAGSVAALDRLGVWERCREHAAPLSAMRIVDDTGRLVRAPEVSFRADEIDLEAFGYNIENRHLVAALEACANEMPVLRRVERDAQSIVNDGARVNVTFGSTNNLTAKLVIGADGRHSICRAAAGIELDQRIYPQTALALSFGHSRPHNDTSTEFHTPSGPFTLVPLPGQRSSLVWVLDPERAHEIAALGDEALSIEIEKRSHSILGKISVEPGRGLFALSMVTARSFARSRIALVGEAAHVMPPIGAQGLNLGLRDAVTIGDLVAAEQSAGGDIAGDEVLARYDRERRADVSRRTLAVDWLNRSLLTDFLPVQGARGLGLYLLDRIGPLRRAVMREGVVPSTDAR